MVRTHAGDAGEQDVNLSADDVVYTINLAADPASKVAMPSTYAWIDKAEKTGDYSVRILMKKPTPAALEYLAMVTPTGTDGLLTVSDVQRAARILAELGPQELLRGVRKVMAQSMTLAHAEVASATLMDDADIDAWPEGTNIMLRLIRAIVAACTAEPSLNAWYDSQAVGRRLMKNIDIGIAVALEGGLITPIVKDADQKSFWAISQEIKALVAKAKAGKLAPEEYMGGTFTISNLGMFGVDEFTAIINPPQAAILAVGGIQPEVYLDATGTPKQRDIMKVTISADHRVVDGAQAAQFLSTLKSALEHPVWLML